MDGCIPWSGYILSSGYGQVKVNGKKWLAHRLVYTQIHGDIPNGLVVRHMCDNPSCVNPSHLELGTQSDNIKDCVARGRHHNMKLSADDVRAIRNDTRSSRKVAAIYGIDHKAVLNIRNRKSYTFVED